LMYLSGSAGGACTDAEIPSGAVGSVGNKTEIPETAECPE